MNRVRAPGLDVSPPGFELNGGITIEVVGHTIYAFGVEPLTFLPLASTSLLGEFRDA